MTFICLKQRNRKLKLCDFILHNFSKFLEGHTPCLIFGGRGAQSPLVLRVRRLCLTSLPGGCASTLKYNQFEEMKLFRNVWYQFNDCDIYNL
jgi:hypothetical protein